MNKVKTGLGSFGIGLTLISGGGELTFYEIDGQLRVASPQVADIAILNTTDNRPRAHDYLFSETVTATVTGMATVLANLNIRST